MDLNDYDTIIKSLVAIAASQERINRRLEETQQDIHALLQQQAVVNTQNTTLLLRIVRTFDRIDEKLDRIFPESTGNEEGRA